MMSQARPAINVLHLLNGEQYSGLERVVDELAEHAPRHGYRCHLLCLKSGEMPGRLRTRQARLHGVIMRHRLDLTGIAAIRKIALREGCRLVVSHTVRSALIARILRTGLAVPWIHHVHSPARFESENRYLNCCNAAIEARALPKADHVIPVSESLGSYVRSRYGIAEHKLTVVPNGVECRDPKETRASPRIDHSTVGIIALLRPRKGAETLVEAIRILVSQGLDVRLRVIGAFVGDAYRRTFEARILAAGLTSRVEFVGFSDQIGAELATLDVFAIPSLYGEGLPMSLLEAMAAGCTIVASRIDGIAETLDHGSCGILVPPGDAGALARGIEQALSDDRRSRQFAMAARARQQALYSVDAMASRVFAIYSRHLS